MGEKCVFLKCFAGDCCAKVHQSFLITDSMTTSLLPVRPFNDKFKIQPTLEIQEFVPAIPEAVHPNIVYTNNFFVYPLMLNFNNQKVYSKVIRILWESY